MLPPCGGPPVLPPASTTPCSLGTSRPGPLSWVLRLRFWGEAKVPPFLGAPAFSIKAPPRQFQPPECKLTPSKTQIGEGRFLCICKQKRQSLFGGCQFPFWRLNLSWGCFIEKGGSPKRVVLWLPARFCIFWSLFLMRHAAIVFRWAFLSSVRV